MIFSSATFFVFFISLVSLYMAAPSPRGRAAVLLSGSLIFYASWKPAYLILLLLSMFLNYRIYCALRMEKSGLLLTTGIVLNLLVLIFYKYLALMMETLFFIGSAAGIHSAINPKHFSMILPLGISFFTFQMISALVDAHRGVFIRSLSLSKWCLYISFFPQLIAGPIVRTRELVDQLYTLPPIKPDNVKIGCTIFLGGIIKKTLLADNIAPIVDILFATPQELNFTQAWLATAAFAMQIYFDFSGYSEMALGLAKFFGIDLPRNFKCPYFSRNVSEFWKRWHITLSQWLRDYLYFPLGGSAGKHANTMRNLLITMLLGGLWHGAGWTFMFWGFLHGLYLIIHRFFQTLCIRWKITEKPYLSCAIRICSIPVTLFAVMIAWVFFRAQTFHDAFLICETMLGAGSGESQVYIRLYHRLIILMGGIAIFLEPSIIKFFQKHGLSWWWRYPFPVRGSVYAALVLILIVFGGHTQKFIYFDF